ncbi:MAG: hypothetical protein NC930_09760 [Candidatus Omnitrophica bacterium]|nr:hypothetical protein [Candidatus Omnitrophota bacterium]
MANGRNNDEIKRLYQDYVAKELDRSRLLQEKDDFLKAYFAGWPLLGVLQFLPSLVLIVMIAVLVWIDPRILHHPEKISTPAMILTTREVFGEPPPVVIKRIVSRTGPTLVYQKHYEKHPITIIWIFSGG